MKIPKKLKIGGHIFKIVLEKESKAKTSRGHNCGHSDRTTGIISINADLIQSEQELTLIHEIFHLINGELNETLLDSLSEQVYQVFKDNQLLN